MWERTHLPEVGSVTSVTRSGLSWLAEGLAVSGLKRGLFYLCCKQEKPLYIHRNVNRALSMTQWTLEEMQRRWGSSPQPRAPCWSSAEMEWAAISELTVPAARAAKRGESVPVTLHQAWGKDRRTGTFPAAANFAGFGENSPPLRRAHKKNWHHSHTECAPSKEQSERTSINGRKD